MQPSLTAKKIAIASNFVSSIWQQRWNSTQPKNWKKRWFVLQTDGTLPYYKNETAADSGFSVPRASGRPGAESFPFSSTNYDRTL